MQHSFRPTLDMGGGVVADYKSQYWDGNRYIATYVITKSPFSWQVNDEFNVGSPVYNYVDDINEWNN